MLFVAEFGSYLRIKIEDLFLIHRLSYLIGFSLLLQRDKIMKRINISDILTNLVDVQ